MLAGVAGGLAAHLRINPWWIRWAFIILSFFGGTGALLYIAAWLLIPDAHEDDTAVSRWLSTVDLTDAGSMFGILLIGAGAVVLGSQVLNISGAFVAAAIMFVVGVMLYRGDLRPRAKERDTSTPPVPSVDPTADADSDSVEEPSAEDSDTVVVSSGDSDAGQIPAAAGFAAAGTQTIPQASPPPPPPPPPPPRPPRPPRERSMLGRLTLAVGLIILSTMALLDVSNITIGGERSGDLFDPIHYVAVALGVVAVGLLVGAFVGRARWLILVGIFILPGLVVTSLWSSVFSWTAGEHTYSPAGVSEVDSVYELGAGQLTVDLSGLDAAELAEVGRVEAKLGLGELRIVVPAGVGVLLDASVGLGDIDVPGPDREGIGPSMKRQFGPSPIVLFIDAEVGAGVVNLTVQEFAGSSS
jgi:phage shock protein PspC (stress-responsive transcriptional regulator)